MSGKSLLVVLTSCDKLINDRGATGWYLPELAHPYYVFKKAGIKLTLASPKGGEAPLDPASVKAFSEDKECQEFLRDEEAQQLVKNTHKLSEFKEKDFDAIFYVGGYGPPIDLRVDPVSIDLVESFYAAGKPTAAVCHAPGAILSQAKDRKTGEPLVKGKRYTTFTDSEEKANGGVGTIPELGEETLTKLGGILERTDDWGVKVVVDGNLITGQNPASAGRTAEKLVEILGA
ncbi:BZ3500_MvSof-1268-A1-R1_Chr7-1g09441 [Microbotryum saponariae]|uniref:D-lactate dehydratase n=1 Tax=Microbotryum saponariae TaxID=289078 RepID=A0A2X0LVS8_9BASI|nr:BZ3501_MvSof-1269-A2-R1_Chr7-1g09146 [Microbotryum saponariae]SDA03453.1 BZ3500_MvSof-1268-A1-R1_Chr7-1g09441 [Microbotryum saponariae]